MQNAGLIMNHARPPKSNTKSPMPFVFRDFISDCDLEKISSSSLRNI